MIKYKQVNKEFEKYFLPLSDTPRKRGDGASEENNQLRKEKAKEQVELKPVSVDRVKELVMTFFNKIGVETDFVIKSRSDFIWMKFTKDNYLGVVASGYDFNFSDTNRSGKYIQLVEQKWNEDLILVFPISKYPEGITRSDLERAVGNYLLEQGIPIIDYYSHNY